jgi:HK97 family phage major capsid protein
MLQDIVERSTIVSRSRIEPMETREKVLWGFDNQVQTSGQVLGGVTVQVVDEGEAFNEQAAEIRKVTLRARKLGALALVSNELLADADGFETGLRNAFSEAIAAQLDYALIHGTGAGENQGILFCASKIEVAKEGSQTAATIKFANVVKMRSRLHSDRGVFIANPDTLPELFQMTHADGGFQSLLQSSPQGMSLFGLPLVTSRNCSTLGSVGDVMLVDLSNFVVGIRADIAVAVSEQYKFANDQTAFRFIVRFDSQDLWDQAITPAKSSTTVGWNVQLAERA